MVLVACAAAYYATYVLAFILAGVYLVYAVLILVMRNVFVREEKAAEAKYAATQPPAPLAAAPAAAPAAAAPAAPVGFLRPLHALYEHSLCFLCGCDMTAPIHRCAVLLSGLYCSATFLPSDCALWHSQDGHQECMCIKV
jgi:hypothetical protein